MTNMRIVFMGTPEFAVSSLDILIKNNFNIVGVVTAPDKPAGRGQVPKQSAIKNYALLHHLKLLQPEKLKDEKFVSELQSLKADLQIVVAFRMLPEKIWHMPKLGTFNLHASLLPKYRGAAPINWAIINGEKETGVTSFKLQHEIDTGNILFQESVKIEDTTTAGQLHDTLMEVGANLILKTVTEIYKSYTEKLELVYVAQDDVSASHAPKITKETCRIDWNKPIQDIYNLIRGMSPYPAAYTELICSGSKTQLLKLFFAKFELAEHFNPNGSLTTDNKTFLKVFCNGGILEVTDLQLEGKKRLHISDFLRGFKFQENAYFISK